MNAQVFDLHLQCNGVSGVTGEYLTPSVSTSQIETLALGEGPPSNLADLQLKLDLKSAKLSVRRGVDANDLSQSGWGVIFSSDSRQDVYEALAPLIRLRRTQANRRVPLFREFKGNSGFTPGLTKDRFLSANGVGPGRAKPERVPYYLLLVGSAADIPYEFQYQLDVQYAVGRIWFDSLDAYARYAESVVAAETGRLRLAKRAAFFGPRCVGDPATELSAGHLVRPLAERAATTSRVDGWSVDCVLGPSALKPQLASLMTGNERRALVFTAGHGVGFPSDHPRHKVDQGALLCQEWAGPLTTGGILSPDSFFSGTDVIAGASPAGIVSFHFACYGAGTPEFDDFPLDGSARRKRIATGPMVAPLARALLSHPSGGALAFVGHIDRAWGHSFCWPGASEPQLDIFEDAISALMNGCTVGYAMEVFNERYAELATELTLQVAKIRMGKTRRGGELAQAWIAHTDARNYVIVGDPAVRLAVKTSSSSNE